MAATTPATNLLLARGCLPGVGELRKYHALAAGGSQPRVRGIVSPRRWAEGFEMTVTVAPNEHSHCVELQIRRRVGYLIQAIDSQRRDGERRHDQRVPYPYPVFVTPCDSDGCPTGEPTRVVLGRHLAERGLDFYHKEPMPYRRVITTFECGDGRWISLVLVLRHCRFSRRGWYRSGGTFQKTVDVPSREALAEAKWEAAAGDSYDANSIE